MYQVWLCRVCWLPACLLACMSTALRQALLSWSCKRVCVRWGAFHPSRGQWLFPCGGGAFGLCFGVRGFLHRAVGVNGVPAWLSHLATASDGAARPLVCMHGAIPTLAWCGGLSLSLSPCTRSRVCIIPQAAPAGSHHILRASCWQEPAGLRESPQGWLW